MSGGWFASPEDGTPIQQVMAEQRRAGMRVYYELMLAGYAFRVALAEFRTRVAKLGGRVRRVHLDLAVDCKPEDQREVARIATELGFLDP